MRMRLDCPRHGKADAAFVCKHIIKAEKTSHKVGFHAGRDVDDYVWAGCDACETAIDDEGYFPDDLVTKSFKCICAECCQNLAEYNGETLPVKRR